MRLIDFGNGPSADNVLIEFIGNQANVYIFIGDRLSCITSTSLNLNERYHLVFTLNQTIGRIYVNGIKVAEGPMSTPSNVMRMNNFIGKSKWAQDTLYANAVYRNIRIFQGALTPNYILDDYFLTPNGKF